MTNEQLQKAKEIENKIAIVDSYMKNYDPEYWYATSRLVSDIRKEDTHGNNKGTLVMEFANKITDSQAIGYTHNKFSDHFKKFLEKCTEDLKNRKVELEKELEAI